MNGISKTFDAQPQPVIGRIVAVRGVRNADGFYPAQTVSYDIDATISGSGVVRFTKQVPQIRLFTGDTEIDAARLIGCACFGFSVMNQIRWDFYEPPALGGCGSPTFRPGIAGVPSDMSGTPDIGPTTPVGMPSPNITAATGGEV